MSQPPRPQGTLSLDELNRIVLEFLHKKGYSRTEAMLRLESSRQATSPQASRGLAAPVPLSSPETYEKAYALFQEWFESSLDMYQPEINRYMYPLFVHMYLELVTLGEPEKALDFFEKFYQSNELLHKQDLEAIKGIRLPQHIEENSVAQQFMQNRYKIKISPTAFDLVLHFLHSIEGIGGSTIIRLINQHFNLVIIPKNASDEIDTDEALNGDAQATADDQPTKALNLGKMPLEQQFKEEVLSLLEYKDKNEPMANGVSLVEKFEEMCKPDQNSPNVESLALPKFKPADLDAAVQRVVDTVERVKLGFSHKTQATLPSVAMYTFHNTHDEMNCLTFNSDGSMAAGGFSDSYIMLWSLKGDKLVSMAPSENFEGLGSTRKLIGHSGAVYGLSFSPDGRTLISCSEDRTVRLWSMDTFTSLVAYRGHTEPIWDVQFGPFGHYFATASHDQTAMLWSTDHIYPLRIFAGHMSDVECVCFHPNGTYLITGSSDKTVRMWDISKGNCVRVFLGHVAPVTAVAVSPNGRWAAAGGEDSVIHVWDIGTGRKLKKMRGHGLASIYSLSFSKDGEVLISAGADCTVRVWDMNANTPESGPVPEPYDALQQPGQREKLQDDKRKEVPATTDHMAVFNTKQTPVYKVQFTDRNLVLAAGAFVQ